MIVRTRYPLFHPPSRSYSMRFYREGRIQPARTMVKVFFLFLLQQQAQQQQQQGQHLFFHSATPNVLVDALVEKPRDHHHHRHHRSPFVDQVTNWLMEQNQPFELISDDYELIQTKTSSMIHLPLAAPRGGTTTTDISSTPPPSSTTTTPHHKVVLGLHLVPTPTCLEECRGPRELLDMTNHHPKNLYYVPATASTTTTATSTTRPDEPPQSPPQSPYYVQYSKIIHLHQDVWEAKPDIVQSRLLMQLPSQPQHHPQQQPQPPHRRRRRIMARHTHARKIPSNVAMEFLQTHHLWGATKAKHSYGLYHRPRQEKEKKDQSEEELVAVATFSHRHKITRAEDRIFQSHELIRFCTQKDMSVVGGISKLITTFIRDKQPDDIVTVVDRDWGDGSGWHSVGFTTVATMDPIVMVVNPHEPGIRRHLVGAGIAGTLSGIGTGTTSSTSESGTCRWGLPHDILDELDTVDTADQARAILAQHDFFVVYDAGVERLFRIVDRTDSLAAGATAPLDVWQSSQPKYARKYYSPNRGISALLEEAAAGGEEDGPAATATEPVSDESRSTGKMYTSDWLTSWQSTSGSAATATLISSAPSSLDLNATVEVRQRSHGWRTVGLAGGATTSIYHAVHKVNPDTGTVEPEAIISDYIRVMAEGFLAVVHSGRRRREDHVSAPLRLLHLGLGGGTLLRLLAHKLVDCHQKAVELDEGVVAVIQPLMVSSLGETSVEVCIGDALKIQRESNELPWDGIFIDIFDEDNLLPPPFYSTEYLRHLRDELLIPHRGVVVLNLHSGGKKRQREIDDAHLAFTQVFTSVRTISARDSKPNGGNMIIIGSSDDEIPSQQDLERLI
jgi:hypothetical protein